MATSNQCTCSQFQAGGCPSSCTLSSSSNRCICPSPEQTYSSFWYRKLLSVDTDEEVAVESSMQQLNNTSLTIDSHGRRLLQTCDSTAGSCNSNAERLSMYYHFGTNTLLDIYVATACQVAAPQADMRYYNKWCSNRGGTMCENIAGAVPNCEIADDTADFLDVYGMGPDINTQGKSSLYVHIAADGTQYLATTTLTTSTNAQVVTATPISTSGTASTTRSASTTSHAGVSNSYSAAKSASKAASHLNAADQTPHLRDSAAGLHLPSRSFIQYPYLTQLLKWQKAYFNIYSLNAARETFTLVIPESASIVLGNNTGGLDDDYDDADEYSDSGELDNSDSELNDEEQQWSDEADQLGLDGNVTSADSSSGGNGMRRRLLQLPGACPNAGFQPNAPGANGWMNILGSSSCNAAPAGNNPIVGAVYDCNRYPDVCSVSRLLTPFAALHCFLPLHHRVSLCLCVAAHVCLSDDVTEFGLLGHGSTCQGWQPYSTVRGCSL